MVLAKTFNECYVARMITSAQSRGARGLLKWSQQDLADAAKIGIVTVRQFENEQAEPRSATLQVIQRALESAGVIFIAENGGGPGVRLSKS
jgi:transcriptional regulator with XRE-family HTH domain